MNNSHSETSSLYAEQYIWISKEVTVDAKDISPQPSLNRTIQFSLLQPLRQWFDQIEVRDRQFAHFICRLIPARCPFERTIKIAGKVLLRIPPMCKLNPLYDQFVGLRFRALCYLADECGNDVNND